MIGFCNITRDLEGIIAFTGKEWIDKSIEVYIEQTTKDW